MTVPRLVGPRVALVPVPAGVASAVAADPAALPAQLAAAGLRAGPGWPHEGTAEALVGAAHAPDADGTWLVVLAGAVVGECGWKGPPDEDGTVELAYGLAPAARGDGVGTEAVALLSTWTEAQPDVRTLAAEVLVGNEPSRRLLRRLGFVERPPTGSFVLAERGRGAGRVRGRHVC